MSPQSFADIQRQREAMTPDFRQAIALEQIADALNFAKGELVQIKGFLAAIAQR